MITMRASIVGVALAVLACCVASAASAYPLAFTISSADRKVRSRACCTFMQNSP